VIDRNAAELLLPPADLYGFAPKPFSLNRIRNLDNRCSRSLSSFAVRPSGGKVEYPNRRDPVARPHLQCEAVYAYTLVEQHPAKPSPVAPAMLPVQLHQVR